MLSRRTQGLLFCTLSLCLFLFIQVPAPAHAQAADDSIQVTSRNTVLTYPKTINFAVIVTDQAATLNDATLNILYTRGGGLPEVHKVQAPANTHSFTFSWTNDLTDKKGNFPPVGSRLEFFWTITDSSGSKHIDDTQTLDVGDNRFNWQHLEKDNYQVNWYGRSDAFGQNVLTNIGNEVKRISASLGVELHEKINLWVYSNYDDFKGALPPDSQEWTGGIAFPSLNQISLPLETDDEVELQRIVPHELTHLIFHQNIQGNTTPVWFDEGLAVYEQDFHEPELTDSYNDALAKKSLLRLSTLDNDFPADSDQALLAYAQSWQLVNYMYQTYGKQKMTGLFQAMDQGRDPFDTDLAASLNTNTAHLEDSWRRSLKQPPTLTDAQANQPVTDAPTTGPKTPATSPSGANGDATNTVVFLLGGLLIIVAFLSLGGVVIHQRNSRMNALRAIQAQQFFNHTMMQYGPPAQPGPFHQQMGNPQFPQTPPLHSGNYADPRAYFPHQPPVQDPRREEPYTAMGPKRYPPEPGTQHAPQYPAQQPPSASGPWFPQKPQE
jgi:hypothetical protein